MSTEQEYDTQHAHSMLDDPDADADGSDPDQMNTNFPPHFEHQQSRQQPMPTSSGFYQPPVQGHPQMMPPQQQQMPGASNAPSGSGGNGQFDMIDPSDPMLDADPFGLSASMHYNTSYSFEPPNQR